jgi:MarR family transcriptional regulator, lower aerobic nicotinate degradation pathway regulator
MLPATETQTPRRPMHRIAKELAASSGFLLARLGFRFKARVLGELEQNGFEMYHYSILAILDEGALQTQATIAQTLAIDPSRLVAVLDALEQDGLIGRQRDPQDRRRHVVSITPDGQRQLQRLRAIFKKLEDEFLAPFDAESREQLHELLVRLAVHNEPSCAFLPPVSPDAPDVAAG